MKARRVIGICGYKRSGKDTVADILVKDYEYHRIALADPMKEVVAKIFMWDQTWVNGMYKETIDERWGISPRQALQHIGTEWAQHALSEAYSEYKETTGRLLWVRRLILEVQERGWERVAIPDVRFPHEVELLRSEFPDFHLVRVDRPGYTAAGDFHESESYVNDLDADVVIDNCKGYTNLKVEVFKLNP